jgi:predicted phosphoserine aminotransferase
MRNAENEFGRFFLPGPTEVRPEVLRAMLRPMIGHRVSEMEQLIATMQPRLQATFRTTRPVYISASSATGLMEGAVRNCARKRVLSLVNGAFSERFFRIALANGLDATPLSVPYGQANTPAALADALAGGDYDAITVVHSETSTGVLNPVAELVRVAHQAGDIAVLVDTVSSLGGAPVETDAWRLDFVLTGSQKSLGLPPGLAFGVATEAMLARAEAKTNRGVYFDFIELEKNIRNNQTPNTPAVSLLYALAEQMERFQSEGIEARWARHAAMARRTCEWVADLRGRGARVSILADEGFRSPTVTCVTVPDGMTGSQVARAAKEQGFVIATGYGPLKESTFRIGHMGDHTVDGLNGLLDALEKVLLPQPL